MPLGWVPRSQDFPRRNRIIAGLSAGLVVVEAAHRSGSLISARLAAEMGRIVFAVPGSPMDPRAAGTNALIKDGATLVTDAEDIAQLLQPMDARVENQHTLFEEPNPAPINDADFKHNQLNQQTITNISYDDISRVENALSVVPVTMDELIRHCELDHSRLCMVLLRLELAGRLIRQSDGALSLKPLSS